MSNSYETYLRLYDSTIHGVFHNWDQWNQIPVIIQLAIIGGMRRALRKVRNGGAR